MKNVVVIPIFNDEYKVICTWGDEKQWRRVARSYHHRIVPGDDVLNGRHGVTLVTPGYHPLIVLHKFPKLPDEVATLAHEAVHAYQASRTTSPAERELLKPIESPGYAKRVAKSFTTRPEWENIKVVVMKRVLLRKFEDSALRQMLLATDTEELVHLSPWDSFWGVNGKGEGQNILGKLLMEIREGIL